jgi:peptidoglycan/xylan/chitin deacetylase (PgdA/CDA1 family)
MVMHPQVTGRPMRINILREFLDHVLRHGDTWIATGREIAEHYERCEKAAAPGKEWLNA